MVRGSPDGRISRRVECVSCGAKFVAPAAHTGDVVECGLCGAQIRVERFVRTGHTRDMNTSRSMLPMRLRRLSRKARMTCTSWW